MGAGESEVTTPAGLRLDDLSWHTVQVHRIDAVLTLTVDSLHITKLTIPGRFYELNIHYGLFVASLGGFRELFLGIFDAFRGCVDELRYNGVDVFRQAQSPASAASGEGPSSSSAGPASVHAVTWDCSGEFDAASDRPFSLVSNDAFLAFTTLQARTGASLACDLKTQTNSSLLFYNGGLPSEPDFLALELVGGRIRFSMDKGNGLSTLMSDASVNDGLWHNIQARFADSYMEVIVDEQPATVLRSNLGESRHLDLVGPLYVGGVELSRQARALSQGVGVSAFKGCIANVKAGGTGFGPPSSSALGLRQAVVTRGVTADCVWEFACLQGPCAPGATCKQEGVSGFRCLCDDPVCVRPDLGTAYKVYAVEDEDEDRGNVPGVGSGGDGIERAEDDDDEDYAQEILQIEPLIIKEGTSEVITPNNIDVVLDLHTYDIRESGVLFHVVEPPRYGHLELNLWRRPISATRPGQEPTSVSLFTLLDLSTDKVRYTHDGSENIRDRLVAELEVLGRHSRLPATLARRHRFVLPISITPVNDPPELRLPPGRVLRMARNTRRRLTSEVLSSVDPDSSPRDLVYTVLSVESDVGPGTGSSGDGTGHVEHAQQPGRPVQSFTQDDVDQGLVSFVHRGSSSARLALRLSDGVEAAPTVVIKVVAFELQLSPVKNTGAAVASVPGATVMVLADNLTFATNSQEQERDNELEIRYEVTRPPVHGQLQLQRMAAQTHGPPRLGQVSNSTLGSTTDGRWQSVVHFTQRQLVQERVRYAFTGSAHPQHDDFRFTTTCNGVDASTSYEFRITFVQMRVRIKANTELLLERVPRGFLSSLHLSSQTEPQPTPPNQIMYLIATPPTFGSLILHSGVTMKLPTTLAKNSTFTQTDVDARRIEYHVDGTAYSPVHDTFQLRVSAPGSSEPPTYLTFSVKHLPEERDAAVTLGQLEVPEGSSVQITPAVLRIETPTVKNIRYRVFHAPRHGIIELRPSTKPNERQDTSTIPEETNPEPADTFTSEDIANGRVFYTHDNSENTHDTIRFIATALEPTKDFLYIGSLHMRITLINDQPPIRAVERVFHVVTGGERPLTGHDLKFVDADTGTKPSDLHYTRRNIPNGDIFKRGDSPGDITPVFMFTQKDLDEGKLIFRHSGSAYGRAVLWVTDGKYFTSGLLEIKASAPFVALSANTGAVAQLGRQVALHASNLSAETNADVLPEDLRFTVQRQPHQGRLTIRGLPASGFTQKDLADGIVIYESVALADAAQPFRDSFTFDVKNAKTSSETLATSGSEAVPKVEGTFEVRLFPASYWQPLEVVRNSTVTVAEGESMAIGSEALSVTRTGVDPRDVMFIITSPPMQGYLTTMAPSGQDGAAPDPAAEEEAHVQLEAITMFDQATINEGRLRYVHTGTNTTSKQLTVTDSGEDIIELDISNGVVSLARKLLHIHVIPRVISLISESPVRVHEGRSSPIGTQNIAVASIHYRDQITSFVLTRPPKHGHIELLTNTPDKQNSKNTESFTLSKLRDGQVIYRHDGSETLEDVFYVVGRSETAQSQSLSVSVLVVPVDDSIPKVVSAVGIEVWESSATPLLNRSLQVQDEDTPAERLVFTVTRKATNGYVALANKVDEALPKFTQAQVDNEQLVFVHSGSLHSNMQLAVSDGTHTTTILNFPITAKRLHLHLLRHETLHVFPGLQRALTSHHLLASTSDSSNRTVTFRVRRPPRFGRLLSLAPSDSLEEDITSFTQTSINSSKVAYRHIPRAIPGTNSFSSTVDDDLILDVECPPASPLLNVTFRVLVSGTVSGVGGDGLERYVTTKHLMVAEGRTVNLTKRELNTSVLNEALMVTSSALQMRLAVKTLPKHGSLKVRGMNAEPGTTEFNQEDINVGSVQYVHDDSDTVSDHFVIGVELDVPVTAAVRSSSSSVIDSNTSSASGSSPTARVTLLNVTLSVKIEPIDDQPFRLETLAPRLEVVRGHSVVITPDVLRCVDPDTPPSRIQYEVIGGPSDGRLVFAGDSPNATATKQVSQFTQEDVDTRRLLFQHQGVLDTAAFHFKVSDGVHTAVYAVFNVHVVRLTLSIANLSAIEVMQGSTSARIRSTNIAASTNGEPEHVKCNVTTPPTNGHLLLNDAPALYFTQADISAERVLYVQRNMSVSEDSFTAVLWNDDVSLSPERIRIVVRPLVRQRPLMAVLHTSSPVLLTPDVLDASQLASQTKSNPIYSVVRGPRHGTLRRLAGGGGWRSRTGRDVESRLRRFTHEDVTRGAIAYELRTTGSTTLSSMANDSFDFVLSAPGVQPARGTFSIRLRPEKGQSVIVPTVATYVPSWDDSMPGKRGSTPATSFQEPSLPGGESSLGYPGVIEDGESDIDDQKGGPSVFSPSLSDDHIMIVGVVAGVVLLAIVVAVVIRCTRSRQSSSSKPPLASPAKSVPGHMPGHASAPPTLPPPPSTLPRSLQSHHHHHQLLHHEPYHVESYHGGSMEDSPTMGIRSRPTSPRLRSAALGGPSRPELANVCDDTWSEVSHAVPTCKVTPLAQGDHLDTNETTLKYPYGTLDSNHLDDWGSYEPSEVAGYTPRPSNPMLRKNQYWV